MGGSFLFFFSCSFRARLHSGRGTCSARFSLWDSLRRTWRSILVNISRALEKNGYGADLGGRGPHMHLSCHVWILWRYSVSLLIWGPVIYKPWRRSGSILCYRCNCEFSYLFSFYQMFLSIFRHRVIRAYPFRIAVSSWWISVHLCL